MNNKKCASLLLFLLFILINSCLVYSQPAQIRGKVIDSFTKRPISNAKIEAYFNGCVVFYSDTTDEEGNYQLNLIRLLKYDLICTKEKFVTQVIKNVTTLSGKGSIVDFYITSKSGQNKLRIEPEKDRKSVV